MEEAEGWRGRLFTVLLWDRYQNNIHAYDRINDFMILDIECRFIALPLTQ
jgi:hypothetical protein